MLSKYALYKNNLTLFINIHFFDCFHFSVLTESSFSNLFYFNLHTFYYSTTMLITINVFAPTIELKPSSQLLIRREISTLTTMFLYLLSPRSLLSPINILTHSAPIDLRFKANRCREGRNLHTTIPLAC